MGHCLTTFATMASRIKEWSEAFSSVFVMLLTTCIQWILCIVISNQKIFSWIIKIQLKYAISGLLLIASQEWLSVGLSNTWLRRWFSENPIIIKLIFGVWEYYYSRWFKAKRLSKVRISNRYCKKWKNPFIFQKILQLTKYSWCIKY